MNLHTRELKIRAYHLKEQRMYYFDWNTVTQTRYPGFYNPTDKSKDCELSDWTLYSDIMFFTGLRNINNKELYEKDIVNDWGVVKVIEFKAPSFVLTRYFLNEEGELRQYSIDLPSWITENPILGNTFETPELIAKEYTKGYKS